MPLTWPQWAFPMGSTSWPNVIGRIINSKHIIQKYHHTPHLLFLPLPSQHQCWKIVGSLNCISPIRNRHFPTIFLNIISTIWVSWHKITCKHHMGGNRTKQPTTTPSWRCNMDPRATRCWRPGPDGHCDYLLQQNRKQHDQQIPSLSPGLLPLSHYHLWKSHHSP